MKKLLMFTLLIMLAVSCGRDKSTTVLNKTIENDAFITLKAVKKHNPSVFEPASINFIGTILIPKTLHITKGCGSNDGGPSKAAQLTIDDSIECRYNPLSTVNKPCQSGNQSQIRNSKRYELVDCDGGLTENDVVNTNSSIKLNLSKADSSEDEVVLKSVILKL